jgi:hypothetical protein
MKICISLCSALLLISCSKEPSAPKGTPSLPKATEVHAAFRDDDMSGPTKSTTEVFESVADLISSLEAATYLGRDLEIEDAKWRGSDDYLHQGWTIITKNKEGIRIRVFEENGTSPKKRFCYVDYFDEGTHSRSGMRHSYYYQLESKK